MPIIYDHQKFGTDIPDICSGKILDILKEAEVDCLIIFPEAGIETLKATVLACYEKNLVPICGGEMTHEGYLSNEGGYIENDGPYKMYIDASKLNVEHFIIPGKKIESMKRYRTEINNYVPDPKFLFPGIGKGQGGDLFKGSV